MESPRAAMLDGSGGTAQAGWATKPARATINAKTTMRATRPIASPYSKQCRWAEGLPAGRRCRQPGATSPWAAWSIGPLSWIDVAEHDPHHVIGGMGALVHAVQPHCLPRADRGERITDAGRHRQHAVHIHRV